MLSATNDSLGRGNAAQNIDWFNPSIAHQCLCSSEHIFGATDRRRSQFMPNRHGRAAQPAGGLAVAFQCPE